MLWWTGVPGIQNKMFENSLKRPKMGSNLESSTHPKIVRWAQGQTKKNINLWTEVKDPETGEALSQEDLMDIEQDVQLNSLDCPIAELI